MSAPRSAVRWLAAASLAAVATFSTGVAHAGASPDATVTPAPAGAAPAGSPPAGSAPAGPVPAQPAGLPAALEDPAPYVPQTSCDPTPKPGTVDLGRLLLATYPGTSYASAYPCGTDGTVSEHYEGRALDWFTSIRDPQGAARAQAFLGWLLAPDAAGHAFANARRLGIMYVIWDNRIWGSYAADAGWRPFGTCAAHPEPSADTSCHRDHVHISLSWAGAMARTSFWSHQVAANDYGPCRPADLNWAAPVSAPNPRPCPDHPVVTAPVAASATLAAAVRYSGATVGPGSTGPVAAAVQRALGITPDGAFGPVTAAAVSTFRLAHGLPGSATMDAAAWRALLAVLESGSSGSVSTPSGPTSTPSSAGSIDPVSAPGAAQAGTAGGRTAPSWTPLQYGATGAAVAVVQRALHVTPDDGLFGPVTRSAVLAFQRAHGLPATGAVDVVTARALGLTS